MAAEGEPCVDESLPEEVEQQSVEAVSQEVALELSATSGNAANKFRCCLCLFRTCGRADKLGKHVRKLHDSTRRRGAWRN